MKKLFLVTSMLIVFAAFTVLIGCTSNKPITQNQTPPSSSNTTGSNKSFTLDDLKKYNGQNGNPAYVAVSGIVYDVTNAKKWRNGKHEDGAAAGMDLTNMMGQSPHGTGILSEVPKVGTLK